MGKKINDNQWLITDGDTLESVAKALNNKVTVEALAAANGISVNADLSAMVGTILVIPKEVEAVGDTVEITYFGLVANTTRNLIIMWDWDTTTTVGKKTSGYKVIWSFWTGNRDSKGNEIWIEGSNSSTSDKDVKFSTYNAPDYAQKVKVKVRPVKEGETASNPGTNWCADQIHNFNGDSASAPSSIDVKIERFKLTVDVNGLDEHITKVEFQVVKDHNRTIFEQGSVNLVEKFGSASWSIKIAAGSNYRVRCRTYRADNATYSDWSAYSNVVEAMPSKPTINSINVLSKSSVSLKWDYINNANEYAIQYAAETEAVNKGDISIKDYFDKTEGADIQTVSVTVDADYSESYVTHNIIGLGGSKYYIRVCAINSAAQSEWSNILPFSVGTTPTAPTTWSSTTKLTVGESLKLYWVHNSEDNSNSTGAKLNLTINGESREFEMDLTSGTYTDKGGLFTVSKSDMNNYNDKVYICTVDTMNSIFDAGSMVEWKVCTAGVVLKDYGKWSATRTVDIYEPPALSFYIYDLEDNPIEEYLTGLPFYIKAEVGNTANQHPTGYYVSITSNESYETVDLLGNDKNVTSGSKVYSKYIDTSETSIEVKITASDINLVNNIKYTVHCIVSMSSGLTDEGSSKEFKVAWSGKTYVPFADVGINYDTVSTYIRPYSSGGNDVLLSVYRREFDGSFTEIGTDINNDGKTYVTDPHPALDYARYRIVAVSKTTGAISYNDIPAVKIGEKSIIMQWDEDWQDFYVDEEYASVVRSWAGSMLKLPYNIDVSDSFNPDVSLINYIGRANPVSYYGTQLGATSSWNTVIPKSDKETLYAIRRLATWLGDVYVREPSGSGYRANVTVSFSQKHRDLTIPITFNVTRVEGDK